MKNARFRGTQASFIFDAFLVIPLGVAVCIGTFLRLHMISGQDLLIDEWRSSHMASVYGFKYILSHIGSVFDSIPLNFYKELTLRTIGWNEVILRLPSVLSGLFSLLLFPLILLSNKTFNKLTVLVFSFLLSVSPLILYYSRNAQAYSIVTLLSFTAVFSLYFWLISGKKYCLLIYIGTAILSIYFYLLSALVVLSPLCFIIVLAIFQGPIRGEKRDIHIVPGISSILLTGLIFFVWVYYLFSLTDFHQNYAVGLEITGFAGENALQSLFDAAMLISGTSAMSVMAVFLLLIITGYVFLLSEHKLLALIFSAVFIGFFMICLAVPAIEVSSPDIVVLILPVTLVLVSFGINKVITGLSNIHFIQEIINVKLFQSIFALVFILIFFLSGPLSAGNIPLGSINKLIGGASVKNDFYQRQRGNVPEFYEKLSKEKGEFKIIEYPMITTDDYSLYHYYQSSHGKKVVFGYYPSHILHRQWQIKDMSGVTVWPVEVAMSNFYNQEAQFDDIINLYDINALRNSKAKYVILHKHVKDEIIAGSDDGAHGYRAGENNNEEIFEHFNKFSLHLKSYYQRYFGAPVFEDALIAVFQI